MLLLHGWLGSWSLWRDTIEVLGKDFRTYAISAAILNEEIEHEAWFSEFIGEGPSGHFRRGKPGASPYVAPFMTADHK